MEALSGNATWMLELQAVESLGGKALESQIADYVHKHRPDIKETTVRLELTNLAVNANGRTSMPAGKEPRRTDGGHKFDRLFKTGTGEQAVYELYDPAKHGVWEIYRNADASSSHGTLIRKLDDREDIWTMLAKYPTFKSGKVGGSQSGQGSAAFIWRAVGYLIEKGTIEPFSTKKKNAENLVLSFWKTVPNAPDINRNLQEVGNARSAWREWLGDSNSVLHTENRPLTFNSALPMPTEPLNQILYGPPGTGKTYATIDKALAILEPDFSGNRAAKKAKFDEYAAAGQIQFVTFHQSFSYEDFVEGIRAETNETTRQLEYNVEDGVFKQLCNAARRRVVQSADKNIDLKGRRIWKISLGEAGIEEGVYEDSIQQGLALIGFGGNTDFSGVQSREDISKKFRHAVPNSESDYTVAALNTFIRQVKIGDILIATQGNLKFRAIGEVASDYVHVPRENDTYSQGRKVNWLCVYEQALPYQELMENRFSQRTIYELRAGSINPDKLAKLLAPAEAEQDSVPRVLIIDEINRGNISRIFGELITLIESSKRSGQPEALEVTLPYSKEPFSVPDNVYLLGTMNTADRSLAGLDVALRRRFVFEEMPPRPEMLEHRKIDGIDLTELLTVLNQRIEVLLGRDHLLGHAYFIDVDSLPKLIAKFQHQIIPLLQEYFFEDWEKIALVLNDPRKAKEHQFLSKPEFDMTTLFGANSNAGNGAPRWAINATAFELPDSYIGIYAREPNP